MTINEFYCHSEYPSEPARPLLLEGMRTFCNLPSANFLTMYVLQNYLAAADSWDGNANSRKAIQRCARDITLVVSCALGISICVVAAARSHGHDYFNTALLCCAAWIELCRIKSI